MLSRNLSAALIPFAVLAAGYTAGSALGAGYHEYAGPLHIMGSPSAPDAEGVRQKIWAMAPGLTGNRTYVYRLESGAEVLNLRDADSEHNDAFDMFCPGSPGATPDKTLTPDQFGPGTLELHQDGRVVFALPVVMCEAPPEEPAPEPQAPETPAPAPAPPASPPAATPPIVVPGPTAPPPAAKTPAPKFSTVKKCNRVSSQVASCRLIIRNTGKVKARIQVVDRLPSGTLFGSYSGTPRILGGSRAARWQFTLKPGKRRVIAVRMRYTSAAKAKKCNRSITKLVGKCKKVTRKSCVTFPARPPKVQQPPVTG